jgi:hypothetical protein
MSQDVRTPAPGVASTRPLLKGTPVVHCGDRPGDLRVKVERRPRGRLEQASLRVRAIVSRVKAH